MLFCCSWLQKDESSHTPDPAAPTEATVLASTATNTLSEASSEEEDTDDCQSVGRRPKSQQTITAAIQKLGVQLLQNLQTTPEQPNVIISPLSISLALSQLALGTEVIVLCMSFPHSMNLITYRIFQFFN